MINAAYNHYPSVCDLKVMYAVLYYCLTNRGVRRSWGALGVLISLKICRYRVRVCFDP